MDVRRAVAVPADGGQQLAGGAVGRHAVAGGQDAAELILALAIRLDLAAQVPGRLRAVEEGIAALGVGVPDVDDGVRHRVAGGVADLATHEQDVARLRVLVEAGAALLERRVGDPEWALDGARRAALEAGQALFFVEAEVEEVLETEAGGEQAALVGLADLADVTDGGPELGRGDVEFFDGLEQVAHDALDDGFQARVAGRLVEAGELFH